MSLLNYGFTKTKCDDSSNSSDDVVFIEKVVSPKCDKVSPKTSNIKTVKQNLSEEEQPKSSKKNIFKEESKNTKPNVSDEEPKNKQMDNKKEKDTPKKDADSLKKVSPKVLNKSSKVLISPSQNSNVKNITPKIPSQSSNSNVKNITPKIPKMFSPKNVQSQVEPSKVKSKVEVTVKDSSPRKSYENSLPAQRIKLIMKSCPDVEIVPQESLHIVTRATELFVQQLAFKSIKSGGRLDYECLSNHVHSDNSLEFLKETIPKKITWAECQKLIAENKQKEIDVI